MKPSTFEKNAERMGYPEFRRQHLFIGTGVIEAGLQNRDPLPVEAVWHVLDRARRERKFWLSAAANSMVGLKITGEARRA